MPRRKKMTANEMIRNGGMGNFRRAVRHAARYGKACRETGRLLDLQEYIEASGLSQAQAYREQAAWRSCCGELSVLEVVSSDALEAKGFTDAQREDVIARSLAGAE
jgi:hypothetical protein